MKKWLLVLGVIAVVTALAVWQLHPGDREGGDAPPPAYDVPTDPVERGRELVTLADCKSCHTVSGGAAFAGGRAIPTPFGTFFSPNITQDPDSGIGSWSATDFWHAIHNGYSKEGRLLYPAFPYTNFTRISRADSDAMYAYLKTVGAVAQSNRPHELVFPYNHRLLLAAWRALYFRPGVYQADAARGQQWNRGAYLIEGAGHCSACHAARNALGATRSTHNPAGGLVLSWYAPALDNPAEAGVHDWSSSDIVRLLKSGQSGTATTLGPMAEVVAGSLQYAHDEDLQAMATYLKSLPIAEVTASTRAPDARRVMTLDMLKEGEALYAQHCASCHGVRGEGLSPAGPALAGNRLVTMASPRDLIRIVLFGGYAPGTAGNPRPFGMPPYSPTLTDVQIAIVLSYLRASWGNNGSAVYGDEVAANRSGDPSW